MQEWTFYYLDDRITAIRINSHELHSEIGHWSIPKTPWDERVCHLCDTKKVEDEKHFLLDCPANILTQQKYKY
jgi:hypothetical protein